ncbi:MAG: hypothetical protein ACJARR_002698 [Pseudophaeobacter arcticus]|jgi:hypothetical protein|uniref:ferritin-like domain-containing protein n=2 Tax=Pseudophaeobacter arcticus TaxID=385492 RepID=UPI0039E2232D
MNIETNLKHVQDMRETFDLSQAEVLMVAVINAGVLGDKDTLKARLIADLQAAIQVELATIPLYLYSYYSINRTKLQGKDLEAAQIFANEAGGIIMSVAVEEMLHMSLSSNIYFALTGQPPQLYQAAPQSYPALLPHHNPVVPEGPDPQAKGGIPLRPFCSAQLWHFLQIEYPHNPYFSEIPVEALPDLIGKLSQMPAKEALAFLNEHGWPMDQNWNSIGQFYSFIRCIVASAYFDDADFQAGNPKQQIQPYNYAPNNIDTIYPKQAFDPSKPAPSSPGAGSGCPAGLPGAAEVTVYADAADSSDAPLRPVEDHKGHRVTGAFELMTVSSREDVMLALETICEQGEGYSAKPGGSEATWDDPDTEAEQSHFDKFLELQMQFEDFSQSLESLPPWMEEQIDLQWLSEAVQGKANKWSAEGLKAKELLFDYPDNPTRADYAHDPVATALNDFCSGLFQYMLILSETIYKIEPNYVAPDQPGADKVSKDGTVPHQKYFFNIALHRSMIWILDKFIALMRGYEVTLADGRSVALAPSFDNLGFGPAGQGLGARQDAFANLAQLGAEALLATAGNSALNGAVAPLVALTINKTSSDGEGMHLPDVSAYWPQP